MRKRRRKTQVLFKISNVVEQTTEKATLRNKTIKSPTEPKNQQSKLQGVNRDSLTIKEKKYPVGKDEETEKLLKNNLTSVTFEIEPTLDL